jgi:hypothetical protein
MSDFCAPVWPERLGLVAKFVAKEFPGRGLNTASPGEFLCSLSKVSSGSPSGEVIDCSGNPNDMDNFSTMLERYATDESRLRDMAKDSAFADPYGAAEYRHTADNLAYNAPELIALSVHLRIRIKVAPEGGRYGTFMYEPYGRKPLGVLTLETAPLSVEWECGWARTEMGICTTIADYTISCNTAEPGIFIEGPPTTTAELGFEVTIEGDGSVSENSGSERDMVGALATIIRKVLIRQNDEA